MNFETFLRRGIEADEASRQRRQRVLLFLARKGSPRRGLILHILELRCAHALGMPHTFDAIDWSAADWVAVGELVIQIVLKFLPLLLAL